MKKKSEMKGIYIVSSRLNIHQVLVRRGQWNSRSVCLAYNPKKPDELAVIGKGDVMVRPRCFGCAARFAGFDTMEQAEWFVDECRRPKMPRHKSKRRISAAS